MRVTVYVEDYCSEGNSVCRGLYCSEGDSVCRGLL